MHSVSFLAVYAWGAAAFLVIVMAPGAITYEDGRPVRLPWWGWVMTAVAWLPLAILWLFNTFWPRHD